MKKLSLTLMIVAVIAISACNSQQKTGNAQADSGSHGSSGAIDTTTKSSSMGTSASGTSPASGSSDTTKTSH